MTQGMDQLRAKLRGAVAEREAAFAIVRETQQAKRRAAEIATPASWS